jgi:hypothetical protein
MPVTVKARQQEEEHAAREEEAKEQTFTRFLYRPNWFVLCQTEGREYVPQDLPQWQEDRALAALGITRVPFTHLDGNAQGFAKGQSVSVSPIAFAPHRTLFHELAHVVLGHTAEGDQVDDEHTPRSIREVEAESVAMICCEALALPGAKFSRGYIQHWLNGEVFPERSATRIFKAADRILRAGRGETGGEQ